MDLSTPPEFRVAAVIARFPCVDRVTLFGSRARGDADPRSDIDLAVDCPRASAEDWFNILDAVEEADTLLFIDLVRLDQASADLRTRVKVEGRVLYDRETQPVADQSRAGVGSLG